MLGDTVRGSSFKTNGQVQLEFDMLEMVEMNSNKSRNYSSYSIKSSDHDQSSIDFNQVHSTDESYQESPALKTAFSIYSSGELFLKELPWNIY
jgi:hypothetical protein